MVLLDETRQPTAIVVAPTLFLPVKLRNDRRLASLRTARYHHQLFLSISFRSDGR